MSSNTFSDFISDIGVTDHRHYDQLYRKKNWESSSSAMLLAISPEACNCFYMQYHGGIKEITSMPV